MVSQKDKIGSASVRIPASREISSASVDEWDTVVCFLHCHEMGANVRDPTIASMHPVR